MEQIVAREIVLHSLEYENSLALRQKVLRAPLGLGFSSQELAHESECSHFAAFLLDALVGTVLLVPLNEHTIKMRQVAVEPTLQGKGVGKVLVEHAEAMAKQRGYREIVLDARHTAIEFYDRLGYERVGKMFLEDTIPHLLMKKCLL